MQDDKQSALEERMQALMLEDNVGSAATVCARYPRLGGKRELSKFEMDLRDWGLCCGITFGLARAESPDEANETIAERAYTVARLAYQQWAGAISDPEKARQKALRDVVVAFHKAEKQAHEKRRYQEGEMTNALHESLIELANVVGITS
jgi:hypothetical protein